ncbi:MAG TPA: hypothetical protein VMZ28_15800, partial [Kofleriaceae bacterium]|nr:hypothetical protein [Kofleriaceae bacterium]
GAGATASAAAPGAPGGGGGATAAAAAAGATGFAVFPGDSQLLVGVNFGALRASPMWAKSKDQVEAGLPPELKALKAECGFDPVSELQTVIFAGSPQKEEAVLVVKGLKRATIKTCIDKMAAKGEKVSVTEEGNIASFNFDGEPATGAWMDDTTLVLAPKKDKAYVEARLAGTSGLADTSPLMGLLKSVDTSASIYFVADLTGAGALPVPGAKGAFGSLKISDGLALDAGGRFDTADNAKGAHTMATQGLAMVKQKMPPLAKYADKAKLSQKDNDVILQLSLSEAELTELQGMMQGMAGMLGGGMGGGL